MFYLYNPSHQTYIGRNGSNNFFATHDYSKTYLFNNYFTAQNVLDNGNLRKDVPGREGFVVMQDKLATNILSKPTINIPSEHDINLKANFSFDELEKEIKENKRKIKTCATYLKNVFASVEKMDKTLELVDNKVVLIYHFIEGGYCKTDEDKLRIEQLLNRTLLLRRELKKQRAVYASMKESKILDEVKVLPNKIKPFSYWKYDSIDEFIKVIEESQEVIK